MEKTGKLVIGFIIYYVHTKQKRQKTTSIPWKIPTKEANSNMGSKKVKLVENFDLLAQKLQNQLF